MTGETFEHDFGTVYPQSLQHASFTCEAAGEEPLVVSNLKYGCGCTAGEPWVVVRDGSGALRAFYNACRHKGREVVQGSGRADALVCGYHAWTYSLDGRLKSAPPQVDGNAWAASSTTFSPWRAANASSAGMSAARPA